MLIVNPMLEGLTGPTKVKCQRHCRILKWNYEKLPRRDLVFCEESQKPAGGVEVVEFHDCYVEILLFWFQISLFTFPKWKPNKYFPVICHIHL